MPLTGQAPHEHMNVQDTDQRWLTGGPLLEDGHQIVRKPLLLGKHFDVLGELLKGHACKRVRSGALGTGHILVNNYSPRTK